MTAGSPLASKSVRKGDLVLALAGGAVAALPAAQRARAEAQFQGQNLSGFRQAAGAWLRGNRLKGAAFAERFFGRSADDPVVLALRRAIDLANIAQSPADMAQASSSLADAMTKVGLDRWSRFIADAQARARDPATEAAIADSLRPTDPRRDAIRPVYPEIAVGLGTAGLRGAAALARAAAGLATRRLLSEKLPGDGTTATGSAEPRQPLAKPNSPATPGDTRMLPISRQKQDSHIAGKPQNRNRIKQRKPTSTFDGSQAEADAVTQEAWQKGTALPKRPNVRDYDFGRRIGTGGLGGSQSRVRVYRDSSGRIHGHPEGPEIP